MRGAIGELCAELRDARETGRNGTAGHQDPAEVLHSVFLQKMEIATPGHDPYE